MIAQSTPEPMLISIVSESLPHLKRGVMRDFFNIMGEEMDNNKYFNKTEGIYSRPEWKGKIEFFGADDVGKSRGPRRHILYINEGNNVRWETAQNLDMRTSLWTVVDWNPVSEFWVYQYESGGKIVPGWRYDTRSDYVHSTYLDAKSVLPKQVVEDIESNKDKDPNWWSIYGLGELGKVEGLVYPYFEQVPEMPKGNYGYGLDWGFSGDPTVLVQNLIIGDKLYSREIIYKTGMLNDELAREMDLMGLRNNQAEIIADNEVKSIVELQLKGFNIKACEKGKGSVEWGIKKVNQYKQFWTTDSLNCIKEQRNFRFRVDRMTGRITNDTTHEWSHGMDARRYFCARDFIYGHRNTSNKIPVMAW